MLQRVGWCSTWCVRAPHPQTRVTKHQWTEKNTSPVTKNGQKRQLQKLTFRNPHTFHKQMDNELTILTIVVVCSRWNQRYWKFLFCWLGKRALVTTQSGGCSGFFTTCVVLHHTLPHPCTPSPDAVVKVWGELVEVVGSRLGKWGGNFCTDFSTPFSHLLPHHLHRSSPYCTTSTHNHLPWMW